MITPLEIPGAFRLSGNSAQDHRGAFRKVFDAVKDQIPAEFREVDEVAISHNRTQGTLRGLHFQAGEHAQTKVVWAAQGRILDVLVDVRPGSPAYGRWVSVELSAEIAESVLVPIGVAHGFQTLEDDTSVVYLMRGAYAPEAARTIRWDDPTLGIAWPLPVSAVSESDRRGALWPPS